MSSTAWKDCERRVAKLFKGVRLWRPDFGDSIPDGESDTHTWDTKCYQRHAAVTLFVENEKKYKGFTGKRRFVLVLFSRERKNSGEFVVVRAKDYIADQEELARSREPADSVCFNCHQWCSTKTCDFC